MRAVVVVVALAAAAACVLNSKYLGNASEACLQRRRGPDALEACVRSRIPDVEPVLTRLDDAMFGALLETGAVTELPPPRPLDQAGYNVMTFVQAAAGDAALVAAFTPANTHDLCAVLTRLDLCAFNRRLLANAYSGCMEWLMQQRNWQAAISYAEAAIAADASLEYKCRIAIGWMRHEMMGDAVGARDEYLRAVALRPKDCPPIINLAWVTIEMGHIQEAQRLIVSTEASEAGRTCSHVYMLYWNAARAFSEELTLAGVQRGRHYMRLAAQALANDVQASKTRSQAVEGAPGDGSSGSNHQADGTSQWALLGAATLTPQMMFAPEEMAQLRRESLQEMLHLERTLPTTCGGPPRDASAEGAGGGCVCMGDESKGVPDTPFAWHYQGFDGEKSATSARCGPAAGRWSPLPMRLRCSAESPLLCR